MFRRIPGPVLPELVEAHSIFALLRLNRREDATSRLQLARAKHPDDVSGCLDGINALLLADSEPGRAMALSQDPGFQALMADLQRQSSSLQRALLSDRP